MSTDDTAPADCPAGPERLLAPHYTEEVLTFECFGDRLLGVLSLPIARSCASGTAMVIVVGGPQYRAGAHRQFVQLARSLAAEGHAVMRFDARGMGDGSGRRHSFEDSTDDIRAAIGALRSRLPTLRRLTLFGLCDGASAALLCLGQGPDLGVDGICLLNPWVRSEATLARTQLKHYYRQRVADPAFWRKVVRGGVGTQQLLGFFRLWRKRKEPRVQQALAAAPTYQQAMAHAWRNYPGQILLLISDDDLTAHEFIEHARSADDWRGLLDSPRVRRVTLACADHTLSSAQAQSACERATLEWLAGAVHDESLRPGHGGSAQP